MLEDSLEYEEIEKTPIEDELQKSKQEQPSGFTDIQNEKIDDKNPSEMQNPERHLGFFGTLGVSFLSIANRAVGGEEIEVEGIKILDAKTMDELVINEMIASGNELDIKYMKDKNASPELRYGLSFLLFFSIKGRMAKVKEWLAAHRKKKEDEPK
jgi:hypothetical protein